MRIWLDGEVMPIDAARISPLDRGLTVGDGVFETLRVYAGRPFAWRRHHARLRASADGLGLSVPDADVLLEGVRAVLEANGLIDSDARVRVTVTGGAGPPGSSRAGATPIAFVVAVPFRPVARTAEVVIAPWTRNEHGATAGLKTISYAANVRALAYAEAHGASEALFANTAGNLCEATGSNVFVALDGELRTPPASAGCLLGVTRALLLQLAAEVGMAAREVDVPMEQLGRAEEAFLTSTTREVQPIASIDGRSLPQAPGPIARRLADAFSALVARDVDP